MPIIKEGELTRSPAQDRQKTASEARTVRKRAMYKHRATHCSRRLRRSDGQTQNCDRTGRPCSARASQTQTTRRPPFQAPRRSDGRANRGDTAGARAVRGWQCAGKADSDKAPLVSPGARAAATGRPSATAEPAPAQATVASGPSQATGMLGAHVEVRSLSRWVCD